VSAVGSVRTEVAPAKLTVSLAVTGVRPDGYHELRAEMVALSLTDELTFRDGEAGLSIAAEPGTRAELLVDDGSNLISRALMAARKQAAVSVVKRIPLGGGLGGGSSDAAAVLRWAGCSDVAVAVGLGADVPFSLAGGRALVEGIGERVTPLPFEARHYLLVLPPFGVDTRKVFAAWDDLERGGAQPGARNELTEAALVVEPRLAGWRDALAEYSGTYPTLAGSGSTWFVEVDPPTAGPEDLKWLSLGGTQGQRVRAHTVPPGWNGRSAVR
jgi:4-diphosphocytidyl-2-C-methyl-D-erythritol kinase